MAGVYADSFLTIVASGSEDDATGCFPTQAVRINYPAVSPDVRSVGVFQLIANATPVLF